MDKPYAYHSQLYPDLKYVDLIQLNYYHTNPDYRRINMMTYKWDNTNYQLEPARNRKWEVRADIGYKGNRLSVTYFRERMNNGFGDLTYYKSLAYKLYDPSSIDGSTLTAPPELSELAYTDEYNLDVYSTVGNVMKMEKEGVEFQFSSKRIELLKTRVTVYGAWIKTFIAQTFRNIRLPPFCWIISSWNTLDYTRAKKEQKVRRLIPTLCLTPISSVWA